LKVLSQGPPFYLKQSWGLGERIDMTNPPLRAPGRPRSGLENAVRSAGKWLGATLWIVGLLAVIGMAYLASSWAPANVPESSLSPTPAEPDRLAVFR
jgi:hypothetical protein